MWTVNPHLIIVKNNNIKIITIIKSKATISCAVTYGWRSEVRVKSVTSHKYVIGRAATCHTTYEMLHAGLKPLALGLSDGGSKESSVFTKDGRALYIFRKMWVITLNGSEKSLSRNLAQSSPVLQTKMPNIHVSKRRP